MYKVGKPGNEAGSKRNAATVILKKPLFHPSGIHRDERTEISSDDGTRVGEEET